MEKLNRDTIEISGENRPSTAFDFGGNREIYKALSLSVYQRSPNIRDERRRAATASCQGDQWAR